MGVPGLFGQYVRSEYPEAITDTFSDERKEFIETIEFDMGGLMHGCAKTVYAYEEGYTPARAEEVRVALQTEDGRKSLEDSFCRTVSARIQELTREFIAEVNPRYKRVANLVMAMDGVAPFAKIMQQRTRRYRSAAPPAEEEEVMIGGYKKMPPPEGWQTNSITPGTPFMEKFDTYMRGWVLSQEAKNLAQYKVIYSSYKKRGEGEHKLFGFRRNKIYTHHRPLKEKDKDIEKGILCVYGLDADLILLNLAYAQRRVYIFREKETRTENQRKEGTKYHGKIINIDILRDEIAMRMTGIKDLNNIDKDSYYSVIRDFILMTFFLGNDFLPRIMCFRDLAPSLNSFTLIYKQSIFIAPTPSKEKVDGFYTSDNGFMSREDGSINWPVFSIFLNSIKSLENGNLFQIGISMKTLVQTRKHIPLTSKSLDKAITLKQENKEVEEGQIVQNNYVFTPDKFRSWWYNLVLGPRTEGMKRFAKDNAVLYLSEVKHMCKLYLEGLQWVLLYYIGGTEQVGKLWTYTYTQSPVLEDIVKMCDHLIANDETPRISSLKTQPSDPVLGPVHQLLSVMPPKSVSLINSLFSPLLTMANPLCYIAPIEFKIDYESSRREHEGLAILPIVDPLNIVAIVKETLGKHKISKEYIGTKEIEDAIIPAGHSTSGMMYSERELATIRYEARQKLQQAGGYRSKSVGPTGYKKPYYKKEGEGEYKKPYYKKEGEGEYKKPYYKKEGEGEYKKPYYKKPGEENRRFPQNTERGGQGRSRTQSEERPAPKSKIITYKPKPLNLAFKPAKKELSE